LAEKKKFVFLTATRADFGKLKPLINVIKESDLFESYDSEIYFDNAHVKYQANKIIAENTFNETYTIVKNFN